MHALSVWFRPSGNGLFVTCIFGSLLYLMFLLGGLTPVLGEGRTRRPAKAEKQVQRNPFPPTPPPRISLRAFRWNLLDEVRRNPTPENQGRLASFTQAHPGDLEAHRLLAELDDRRKKSAATSQIRPSGRPSPSETPSWWKWVLEGVLVFLIILVSRDLMRHRSQTGKREGGTPIGDQ